MRARWRVVLVLGALTLVYFGLQRVGGMSDRFFASTLDGANGLVRYLVGDWRPLRWLIRDCPLYRCLTACPKRARGAGTA